MKKKEVGLRPQRKLKGFECSSHGRYIVSQICQNAMASSKRKRKKKGKETNTSQILRKNLGVFVVVLYITFQKGTKRKCSEERSYPDSNRGNQKFFDISSL